MPTLTQHLTQLESSGLIRLAAVQPELEYLFRHALVQDAAYASILKADRRILHRAVGEALERLYPERAAELAPALAQHFAAAGETEQARKYFTLAGDSALAAYANAEAEQHYRAALGLGGTDAERAPLFAGLGDALYAQARYAEAVQAYREAIRSYQVMGDDDMVARLYARASLALFLGGDSPGGLVLCREGLAATAGQPETRGLAELLHEAGRICHFDGLPDEARPLCERALSIAERLGLVEVQVHALATLGILPDQSDEAKVQILTRAVELAEAAGVRGRPARRARNNLSAVLSNIGDFRTSLHLQRRMLEAARQEGQVGEEIWTLANMMYYHLYLGELDAADELRPAVRRLLSSVGSTRIGPQFRGAEAMLTYYRGDVTDAIRALESARDEARRGGDLESVIRMSGMLAEAAVEVGAVGEAVSAAQEALTGSELTFESETVWALCLLCAARVRERDLPTARRLLDEARTKAGPQPAPLSRARLALAQARLAAAETKWPDALTAFEAAAQLEAQMGCRWYHAQTLREWAEAHISRHEPGDVERARELLREALSEFEAMNAPKYAALVRGRLQEL